MVTDSSSSHTVKPTGNPGSTRSPVSQDADSRLTFKHQFLRDLSFENPNAPSIYEMLGDGPQVSVQLDMTAQRLERRTFEILLTLKAHASAQDRTAFLIEVDYGAVVTVAPSVPRDEVDWLISVEAPRLLFPFARAIVADATRDGGFPPLLINPVDFEALQSQRKARRAEPAAASAGEQA